MKQEMHVTNQRYRLGYHLMTKGGWMNDPNGFSYFKGYYHIFYQYYPYAAEWGPMHWGHARSTDLVHWETLPAALAPGDMESGCFSGSAVPHDGKLWLIYTGHHYIDPKDPEAFYEDQNLAYSEDGIHFTKYEGNPVLRVPKDNTKHFRDPKVWREGDTFYMVVGSQGADGCGRALLYRSPDLIDWTRCSVLAKSENEKTEGYMWECPDFFPLGDKYVLLMSPQGLEASGDDYRNLNQTGYLVGTLDEETHVLAHGKFVEIDRGHDFYATQTMETPDGRRVMMAWMAAWDSPMHEKEDGWAGALTIPRTLRLAGGKVYQSPIREMESLREKTLQDGAWEAGKAYALPRKAEICLRFDAAPAVLLTLTDGTHGLSLAWEAEKNRLVLTRKTKDGVRACTLSAAPHAVRAFLDQSSVEVFVNDGETTFTERIYFAGNVTLTAAAQEGAIYALEAETNTYGTDAAEEETK